MTETEIKLFGKWEFSNVKVNDQSLVAYISRAEQYVPHSAGRYSVKRFRKASCPIIERLVNSLMMNGRNNGKKILAVRTIKQTLEIINLATGKNPLQVVVDAVANGGARK